MHTQRATQRAMAMANVRAKRNNIEKKIIQSQPRAHKNNNTYKLTEGNIKLKIECH